MEPILLPFIGLRHPLSLIDAAVMAIASSISSQFTASGLDEQLRHLSARLVDEFASTLGASAVHACIQSAVAELGSPSVTKYVPVLVERRARKSLSALASS